MILALVIGFALREFADMRDAVPWSLLAGLVVAPLIPVKPPRAVRSG